VSNYPSKIVEKCKPERLFTLPIDDVIKWRKPKPMENRILKHRSCEQPEDVGAQFATSGSKLTVNNNKIYN